MYDEPDNTSKEGKEFFHAPHNDGEINRARKSLIYELFILGELMDGPYHGYHLREILSDLLGPFRQISWGVLYPLIRQLEREQLLVSDPESSAGESQREASSNRQRKQYAITTTGRERFYALMLEQSDFSAEFRDLFLIKLNNFDHLSRKQKLVVLRQYQEYLQFEDVYLLQGKQHALTDSDIPDPQRPHVLRIIDFRESTIRGEIEWIEQQIRSREEQSETPG